MSHPQLTTMLAALLADPSDDACIVAVREALAEAWPGIDADALFVDDVLGDAQMALDVLEARRDTWVARVLQEEDDEVDVAGDVMAALFGGASLPWAEAVAHEAGPTPEVAAAWSGQDVPVAEAVRAEAGPAPELAHTFDAGALPIAEAVAAEAGTVDVVDAVVRAIGAQVDDDVLPEGWLAGLLDHGLTPEQHTRAVQALAADASLGRSLTAMADVGREVREAVLRGAGPAPAMWAPVSEAIGLSDPDEVPGWDEALLGQAVRSEAGDIDVVKAVMATIQRDVRAPQPDLPEAANEGARFPWAGLIMAAVAAAALLSVLPSWMAPVATPDFVERPIAFASSDELQVDRIAYGGNASVFVEVPDNDEEPIIIWVDDGGSL